MTDNVMPATENEASGKRKEEHLRIALNRDVEFKGISTGLEDYQFIHQALPEIDLDDVDLSTELFGKTFNAPIIVSSMVGITGGEPLLHPDIGQIIEGIVARKRFVHLCTNGLMLEEACTGTGLFRAIYLRYDLYRMYFSWLALAKNNAAMEVV